MKSGLMRIYLVGILLLVVAPACRTVVQDDRPAGGGNLGGDPSTAETATINVVAQEFEFSLDSNQAKAGALTFVVRNEGHTPHDFALSGEGISEQTRMLDPGETATLEVNLGPGTYEYACTIPGHARLGMKGAFTVMP